MNNPPVTKKEWRDILLSRRREVTEADREMAAESAAQLILNFPVFQQAQQIACYYPFKQEFNCLPIIEKIWAAGKNCYLPVLGADRTLKFIRYRENTSLKLNDYSILEPENGELIAIEQLDLVLLPLLGFDKQGYRLGMGSGYYDRTFQHKKKPFLLGVGYETQCVEDLPHDKQDVRQDGVLTEKRVIFLK